VFLLHNHFLKTSYFAAVRETGFIAYSPITLIGQQLPNCAV